MLSKEEVANLARLARLQLTQEEADHVGKDISGILEYVGQVSALSGLEQDKKPLQRNVMREDVAHGSDSPVAGKREKILEAFPKREGDYLSVRKIIEKNAS